MVHGSGHNDTVSSTHNQIETVDSKQISVITLHSFTTYSKHFEVTSSEPIAECLLTNDKVKSQVNV